MKSIFYVHTSNVTGTKSYWFFKRFKVTFHKGYFGPACFDITKGHSSYWIDTPFVDFKIRRNYKGHFIA